MSATSTATEQKTITTAQTAGGELAKADPTPPVITTAEEYKRSVARWEGKYHVLTPAVAFSGIAQQHGLIAAKVLIDHDPDHGEVYSDPLFCKRGSKDPLDDEVAISKVGLRKLALAGGWSLTSEVLRADRHYWMMRGINRFMGLDGAVQEFSATVEYDLRDGADRVRSFSDKQKAAARTHGLRGTEARAFNAACREFGIRQKYTRRELQKSFVVLRMMFMPDMTNEVQARIVTERALQGTSQLYPHATSALPAAPQFLDHIGVDEPVIVGTGRSEATPAAPPSARTFEQVPPPEAPEPPREARLPEGMVLIKDIKIETLKGRSGPFEKWRVIDSNGEEHVTVKVKTFGESLDACWKAQRPVEIVSHLNDYQEMEITEIIPGPDPLQPSLLTPDKL